ncbi:hypothetical protein D9M68_926950 [compost metagenome]
MQRRFTAASFCSSTQPAERLVQQVAGGQTLRIGNSCVVAERSHSRDQRVQANASIRLDLGPFARIGHRGRAHSGHVVQSLLDVLGARHAGHAFDVKGDRFGHDHALIASR